MRWEGATVRGCEGARVRGARVRGARVRRCDGATVRHVAQFAMLCCVRECRNDVAAAHGTALLPRFSSGRAPAASAGMAGAKHFRELACWQLARELKLRLYELSDSDPVRKDFRFREDLRDVAASAPHNIAEGFGRRTNREFAHFLDIARGSLMESQDHLQDAVDRGYLAPREFTPLNTLAKRACGAVAGLQRHLRRRKD